MPLRGCGKEARLPPPALQPSSPKSRAPIDSFEIWVTDLGRKKLVRLAPTWGSLAPVESGTPRAGQGRGPRAQMLSEPHVL